MIRDNVEQIHSDESETGSARPMSRRASYERYHAVAFWFLVVLLFGGCLGVAAAFKYHSSQLDRTVQIGSFLHKGIIYDVRARGQK